MRTNVLRGFISILGAKVIVIFISLLITPFLVRLLGSSLYGDYAFILSLLAVTMILVNAGIFDGIRKYIAEDRGKENWDEHVFGYYLRVATILAASSAFIYILFPLTGLSSYFFDLDFTTYFYLLGILIITRQGYFITRGGLMGLGLEDRSEPLIVIDKILFGITGLSLAYIGYGVAGVLAGQIVAHLLVTIIAFTILFQRLDISVAMRSSPSEFPKRELMSFNGLSVILMFFMTTLYYVDIILLQPMAGSEATGYYRAALVIAEFLWFVPRSLEVALLHSSSELWSNNRRGQINSLISKATRYNLSFVLLLAIGLAVLADDLVPIYFGPEFDAAVLPLLLLLPGVVGFAFARPILAIGQGKGELRILIMVTGAAALLNFGLNLLLIPYYGTVGAAIATSCSYGSMAVLHVIAARQIGFDPINDIRLSRIIAVGGLSALLIFGMSNLIESPILSLIIVPLAGFGIYMTLLIQFRVISTEEASKFASQLPQPISRYVNLGIYYMGINKK